LSVVATRDVTPLAAAPCDLQQRRSLLRVMLAAPVAQLGNEPPRLRRMAVMRFTCVFDDLDEYRVAAGSVVHGR
jgi:hypothetical protein